LQYQFKIPCKDYKVQSCSRAPSEEDGPGSKGMDIKKLVEIRGKSSPNPSAQCNPIRSQRRKNVIDLSGEGENRAVKQRGEASNK